MANMLAALKKEKEDKIELRKQLKQDYKEMKDEDPMKSYTLLKIRKLEDDLRLEYYQLVNDT